MNRPFTWIASVFAAAAGASAAPAPVPAVALDHIMIGAPDLDRAVRQMERQTGVRATYGGAHPGQGTRNALIALDHGAYLEIIAPDPAQRAGDFGTFLRSLPRLTALGWAYRTDDLRALRFALRARGVRVGPIEPGSRRRPDGRTLHWATVEIGAEDEVAPFFIQWRKGSPHPSASAAQGCRLADVSFGGPMKPNVARALAVAGEAAIRRRTAQLGLHVALRCRRGAIRL